MADYWINGSIIAVEGFSPLAHKALGSKEVVEDLMEKYCGNYDGLKYDDEAGIRTYSRMAEDNSKIQPHIEIFDKPKRLGPLFKDNLVEEIIKKRYKNFL